MCADSPRGDLVVGGRAYRLRTLPELSRRSPSSLPEHPGCRRQSTWRMGRVRRHSRDQSLACDPSIPLDVLSCFDPLGNAVHTALTFDLVGEDVLITGAGPIGCMAIPICRHAGARHIVITDVNPYRLDLARKNGRNSRSRCADGKIAGRDERTRDERRFRCLPGNVG